MKEPHSSSDFEQPPQPRRFIRESFREYHAKRDEYLTFRELWFLQRHPGLYRRRDLWTAEAEKPEVVTEDSVIGHAVHAWFLEGYPAFRQRYVLGGPVNRRTGRAYRRNTKAFREWEAKTTWPDKESRPAITRRELWRVQQTIAALERNDAVWQLFEEGAAECVVRANYCRVPCQIRIDWFHPVHGIVELKTCGFIPNFRTKTHFLLHRSLAFQQAVFAAAFYPEVTVPNAVSHPPVHLILAETREPYRVQVHDYDFWYLRRFRYENEYLLKQLAVW